MSQQINLFNPIFLKQKKYFSAVAMGQALGLVLVGALLMTAYAGYRVSILKRQVAAAATQLTASQAQLARFNTEFAPKQKTASLENEIATADVEVKSLQQIFDILKKGDFGNTKGYSEYLKAFSRQSLGGLWLTGVSIVGAGNEIGLQGRALLPELVPAYITRLKHEQVMQGKSFSSLEMHLPQIELPGKDKDSPKVMGPAPYIEFNLQSSGVAAGVSPVPVAGVASVVTQSSPVAVMGPAGMTVAGMGKPLFQTAAAQSDASGMKDK